MKNFFRFSKNKNVNLIVWILLAVVCLYVANKDDDKPTTSALSETTGETAIDFKLENEIIRIGHFSIGSAGEQYDFSHYNKSALNVVDEEFHIPIDSVSVGNVHAEIEITYTDAINIEKSKWYIVPDENSDMGFTNWPPLEGETKTYQIDSTRAIAMFRPATYAAYRKGGSVSIVFSYVLKDGMKGKRTWNFIVEPW